MEQTKNTCKTCKRFRLLYLRQDGMGSVTFEKTDAGLCITPRLKTRREGSRSCEYYVENEKSR